MCRTQLLVCRQNHTFKCAAFLVAVSENTRLAVPLVTCFCQEFMSHSSSISPAAVVSNERVPSVWSTARPKLGEVVYWILALAGRRKLVCRYSRSQDCGVLVKRLSALSCLSHWTRKGIKLSLDRPLGLHEAEARRISRQSAHGSGKVVSTAHRCSTYGGRRDAYRVLVGKPEGRRPPGRPRCRW